MKIFKSLFASVLFLSFFSVSVFAKSPEKKCCVEMDTAIEDYLNAIDYKQDEGTATVFSNLIIKEQGDFYKVDFMVTESDEIVLLSQDFEEEFYQGGHFIENEMESISIPVVNINE